jgi:hypothetical protein
MKKSTQSIWAAFTLSLLITTSLISCQKDQSEAMEHQISSDNTSRSVVTTNRAYCGVIIPDSLAAPEGNKLSYQTYAIGVQIYEVRRSPSDPTKFVWVGIAPSATLNLQPDFSNQVGIHYAGPSWEFTKGPYKNEKAVASKLKQATMNSTAIPWLLLKVVDELSSIGNKVTYIQRVCTTGGLAPTSIPAEADLGKTQSVPYTATYLFYEKK